jgi:hypothetical protein
MAESKLQLDLHVIDVPCDALPLMQYQDPIKMQHQVLLTLLLCLTAAHAQLDSLTAATGGSQRASSPANPGCTTASCSACRAG